MIKRGNSVFKAAGSQSERMNRKTRLAGPGKDCPDSSGTVCSAKAHTSEARMGEQTRGRPLWLLWSVATIVLWGVWGLVSKIASNGVDVYINQLLYTAGLAPLMLFVGWTVWKHSPKENAKLRRKGIFWAFLTGILGGLGNLAFFQALVKGGEASIVAPVTALFPMVTVLLAVVFLKERLGRTQWLGLGLAFVAIYLLSA
jgi:transporter family protein